MGAVAVAYRLAVALWVGGAVLFTFVVTPTVFRVFDRDMAASVVGALMPGYFRWGMACGAVAMACLVAERERSRILPAAILAGMLFVTALHAFVVEPRAAALKRQIPSFVTTSPDDPYRREFRTLHAVSQGGNLAVIGGGVALLVLL